MKTVQLLTLLFAASFAAHADFSYTQTRKGSQGMAGAAAAPQVTKYFFKGSRMLSDSGDTARLIDYGAQTMTTINKAAKTYSVRPIGGNMPAAAGNVDVQIDVKETGQKKTINGYNCSQVIMTMDMGAPASAAAGMKMQVEAEFWRSPDVPGWQNMRAFYQKNGNALASMAGGNPSMQKAMAEMQKKMFAMNGITVLQTIRVKSAGGSDAQMSQAQAGLAQARARLEEMAKQGGQQGEMAKQALARMPGGGGAGAPLFETTMESSDFSAADIPDSVFAIPAGFTQK
ncbi:MAG: DUF4412 domain-containing protein [Bryobacteraceae bacterium]